VTSSSDFNVLKNCRRTTHS